MSAALSYQQVDENEFQKLQKALSPVIVPIEQSPTWGEFDDALPERTFLGTYRYDDGGRFVALASATLYSQKGRDWIWIKHGPLFAHEPNTEMIKKMCSTLKQQFASVKNARPVFVRLSSPNKVKPLVSPFEHTMYDQTVAIDLTKTKEELLAEMSQSGRRSLRKAQTQNIEVHVYNGFDAVDEFKRNCYSILKETALRDRFGVHPENLYLRMLEVLSEYATLYTASHKNSVIAWAITTEYAGTSLYYYGASNIEARDTHAPYLLHWEIIKAMKERSNRTYDFMGIAGKNYPSLANVTTFKLKFSKNVTDIKSAYDLPLRPAKYKLLSVAIKLRRKFH